MGRSVMTLPGSNTAFQTFNPSHYCEEHDGWECEDVDTCSFGCDHSDDFRDYLDWLSEEVTRLWPSFDPADRWIGKELHVIAENAHSIVAVAEYCDLISINLGANYDRDTYWDDSSDFAGLGAHWRSQVESKFLETFSELTKIGTFSNGESVYQKIGA